MECSAGSCCCDLKITYMNCPCQGLQKLSDITKAKTLCTCRVISNTLVITIWRLRIIVHQTWWTPTRREIRLVIISLTSWRSFLVDDPSWLNSFSDSPRTTNKRLMTEHHHSYLNSFSVCITWHQTWHHISYNMVRKIRQNTLLETE